jgi:hypothetical protein
MLIVPIKIKRVKIKSSMLIGMLRGILLKVKSSLQRNQNVNISNERKMKRIRFTIINL